MAHEVSIVIRAKDAATKILHGISGGFRSFIGGIANAGKWLFGIGTQMLAVGKAAQVLIGKYHEAAAATAKLAAVQKSMGYASGFTNSELKKQATDLSELTGKSRTMITSAQAMLATFVNIKGDIFKDAVAAGLDMAAVLQRTGSSTEEVEGAMIQLGKALNDPATGLTALRRVGVSFDGDATKRVKLLQEQGRLFEAQTMIMAELKREFGGAAAEINKTDAGVANLKVAWGRLQAEVGRVIEKNSGLASVTERLTAAIKDLIASGRIDVWAEEVKASLDSGFPVLTKWMETIGKMGQVLAAAGSGFRILSDMVGQASATTGGKIKAAVVVPLLGPLAPLAYRKEYKAATDREAERLGTSDKVTAAAEKLVAQKKQAAALNETTEKAEMEAAQKKAQALRDTEEAARKAGDAAYQAWLDEEAAIIEALSAEAEYDKALTEKKERYAELTAEMQAAREKEANLAPYRAKLALLDRELDLLRDIKAAADDRLKAASAPDARAKQAEAAEAAEAQKKADVADWKRWNRNVAKMGKRGVTLSDEEQKWMQGVFGAHKEKVLAKEAADKAAAGVAAKEKEVAEWRKRMEVLADDQLTEWKKLRTALEANLVAP